MVVTAEDWDRESVKEEERRTLLGITVDSRRTRLTADCRPVVETLRRRLPKLCWGHVLWQVARQVK